MIAQKRILVKVTYWIYEDQKEEVKRIAQKKSKQEKRKVTDSEVVRSILI